VRGGEVLPPIPTRQHWFANRKPNY